MSPTLSEQADESTAQAAPLSEDTLWLLVTDVDNTLLGDDAGLRQFLSVYRRSSAFLLALNSSRPCAHVRATLDELPVLLQPKALIGAMGTEIEMDGVLLNQWTQQFERWDRAPIDAVMKALGFPAHAPELQTRFKASFAVPQAKQKHAIEAIQATGVLTRIVRSGESDFDVLPPDAGKGRATLHLARLLGVPLERMIVAGDSANDVQMFQVAQKGIVVGNARPALRALTDPAKVYFAKGHYANALLEGLDYWGVPIKQ